MNINCLNKTDIEFSINNRDNQITHDSFDNCQSAQPIDFPSSSELYLISWQISYETKFGECIAIVGNTKELGNWKTDYALKLDWSCNNIWKGSAFIDLNKENNENHVFEYKYILLNENSKIIQWEDGQNRFYYFSQIQNEAKINPSFEYSDFQLDNLKRRGIIFSDNSNFEYYPQINIEDVWNKKCIVFRLYETQNQLESTDTWNERLFDQLTSQKSNSDQEMQLNQEQICYDDIQIDQKSTRLIQQNFSYDDQISSAKLDKQDQIQFSSISSNEYLLEKEQNKQVQYLITGNHKILGGLRHPQKMNYNKKLQCWELQVLIERNTEYIRYFYIKKQSKNHYFWEKGSGRFIYMSPLNNSSKFNASAVNSCKSLSIQSPHSSETHFENIKNENLSLPILQSNKMSNTSNLSIFNDSINISSNLNQQINCAYCFHNQCANLVSNRMSGKMHVNPLKKGIFLSESIEQNLDFSLKFDQICEYLYVGPYVSNNEEEIKYLKQSGIDTVLSLQTEEDMIRRQVDKNQLKELYRQHGIEYYNIPIKDKSYKDFYQKSQVAVDKLYNLLRNQKRIVYMHCTGGISRAPQTAILYFSIYKNLSLKKAIRLVCNKRESAYPDEELLHQVYNKSIDSLLNQGNYEYSH